MGAHRKPKTKPTAFAAVVTAAIVVPAGTAAAAGYGTLDSSKSNTRDVSAGLLATRANSAAASAAKATVRRIVATPTPTRTASASAAATTPKPSAYKAPSPP